MKNLLLEEMSEKFDRTEFELSRLSFDVIQAEDALTHCEKYSYEWHQQFVILAALKKKSNLVATRLASLAVGLSNEKTRMGL